MQQHRAPWTRPSTPVWLQSPPPPTRELPGELEPGALPVEPDQGPVPAHLPDDPEHERITDPGTPPPQWVQPQGLAGCQ